MKVLGESQSANHVVEVGIITVAADLAALCAEITSEGCLLVCHGCGDIEAPIAALVVLYNDEEVWALCGACMRKLPLFGAVV
jgi:hypothetical protein